MKRLFLTALFLFSLPVLAAAELVPFHCQDPIILTGDETEDAWRQAAPDYLFDPDARSEDERYPWLAWARADPAGEFEQRLPTTVTDLANQIRDENNRSIPLEDALDLSVSHHFTLIIGKLDEAENIAAEQRLAALNYFEYLYHVYKHRLAVYPATESTQPERAGRQYKIFALITNTGVPGALASGTAVSAADGKAGLVGPKTGFPRRIGKEGHYWGWAHELGHGVRFDTGPDLFRLDDQPADVKRAFRFGFLSEAHTQWLSLRAHYDTSILGNTNMQWAWKRFGPVHGEFLGQKYHSFWIYEQLALDPDLGVEFIRDIHARRFFDPNRPQRTVWDRADELIKSSRYKDDPNARIGDQFALMAARMATMDFPPGELWMEKIDHFRDRHSRMIFFTQLEPLPDRPGWWAPPLWRAPRPTGYNLVPLRPEEGARAIRVELDGWVDPRQASNWSAAVVARHADGRRRYSAVVHRGGRIDFSLQGDEKELFLAVAATPGRYLPQDQKETVGTSLGLGDGRTQPGVVVPMPYRVRLEGTRPRDLVAESQAEMGGGLSRHPNGGGRVEHRGNVDTTAWIGPNAIVRGSAQVRGEARVEDFALVEEDAIVRDRAVVRGHAWVRGQSVVEGEARVEDYATVQTDARLSGRARAGEGILAEATAGDLALLEGLGGVKGVVSGNVLVDGPFAWGKLNLTHGTVLHPGVAQADYSNTAGRYLAYDAEEEHPFLLLDRDGVNHGIREGGVEIAEGSAIDSRVLHFDGTSGFVRLPTRAASVIYAAWRMDVLWHGGETATLLEFVGADENGERTLLRLDTDLRLGLARGQDVESVVSSEPLTAGRWSTVEIDIASGQASIRLDERLTARGPLSHFEGTVAQFARYLARTLASDRAPAQRVAADRLAAG